MAKLKKMGLLGMCDRIGKTDIERLAELTKKAKGGRSAAAFADECGLNPGTISRLINAKFKKNVSDDVVASIAVNAAGRNGKMFKEFLDAQGLVIPAAVGASQAESDRLYEEYLEQVRTAVEMSRKTKADPTVNPEKRRESLVKRIREAVQNRLIYDGYRVARAKSTAVMEYGGFPVYADFVLETDALESEGLERWAFFIDESAGTSFCEAIGNIARNAYFSRPAQNGTRVTAVTTDTNTYYACRQELKAYGEAYDSISMMLVDDRYGLIEAEYVIPREVESAKPFPEGRKDEEADLQEVYGVPDDL